MALPLLVLALSAAALGRRSAPFRALAAVQGAVYALGAAGLALGGRGVVRARVVALPAYFCLVNLASLQAVWNVVRRRDIDHWEPRRSS
jgi:hypothetical protein